MKFLIGEETAEQFVNMASVLPVTIWETVYTGERTVFAGKAEEVYTLNTVKLASSPWINRH